MNNDIYHFRNASLGVLTNIVFSRTILISTFGSSNVVFCLEKSSISFEYIFNSKQFNIKNKDHWSVLRKDSMSRPKNRDIKLEDKKNLNKYYVRINPNTWGLIGV